MGFDLISTKNIILYYNRYIRTLTKHDLQVQENLAIIGFGPNMFVDLLKFLSLYLAIF